MSARELNATPEPLRVGDRVRIHSDWQDSGDDEFVHVVIEAPPDSPRVLIRTIVPGFTHHPTEWIGVEKLIRLDDVEQPPAGRCANSVRRPACCARSRSAVVPLVFTWQGGETCTNKAPVGEFTSSPSR